MREVPASAGLPGGRPVGMSASKYRVAHRMLCAAEDERCVRCVSHGGNSQEVTHKQPDSPVLGPAYGGHRIRRGTSPRHRALRPSVRLSSLTGEEALALSVEAKERHTSYSTACDSLQSQEMWFLSHTRRPTTLTPSGRLATRQLVSAARSMTAPPAERSVPVAVS